MELVREKFKTWVTDNWEPNGDLITWRTKLAMAGWACPSWPKAWYGKDLQGSTDRIIISTIDSCEGIDQYLFVGQV